ncbi:MAG: replication terminator protein [Bacillus sp. (in: Bacteria)]|nr:replication terminator protein [Bacillus sp. (in: firmicutes)]MCM1427341.1 hypothetical protein [Eubacterium sp.]
MKLKKEGKLMNLDLGSIGGGALQERFNREMEKIVKNMKDPNTSYKDVRKVTITLTFNQDEERNTAACQIDVASKLAKSKTVVTNFGIGRDLKTNQYVAKEYGTQIPGQLGLEDVATPADGEEHDNVKKFDKQKLQPAIGG